MINKFVHDFKHPLLRIEEIFVGLHRGDMYTKLDWHYAYDQLELTHETKNIIMLYYS